MSIEDAKRIIEEIENLPMEVKRKMDTDTLYDLQVLVVKLLKEIANG